VDAHQLSIKMFLGAYFRDEIAPFKENDKSAFRVFENVSSGSHSVRRSEVINFTTSPSDCAASLLLCDVNGMIVSISCLSEWGDGMPRFYWGLENVGKSEGNDRGCTTPRATKIS
jgi:hypothetical protein